MEPMFELVMQLVPTLPVCFAGERFALRKTNLSIVLDRGFKGINLKPVCGGDFRLNADSLVRPLGIACGPIHKILYIMLLECGKIYLWEMKCLDA